MWHVLVSKKKKTKNVVVIAYKKVFMPKNFIIILLCDYIPFTKKLNFTPFFTYLIFYLSCVSYLYCNAQPIDMPVFYMVWTGNQARACPPQ